MQKSFSVDIYIKNWSHRVFKAESPQVKYFPKFGSQVWEIQKNLFNNQKDFEIKALIQVKKCYPKSMVKSKEFEKIIHKNVCQKIIHASTIRMKLAYDRIF